MAAKTLLEKFAQDCEYHNIPEAWRVPTLEVFSRKKTLFEYQQDALKKAAKALFYFYHSAKNGKRRGDSVRKHSFCSDVYGIHGNPLDACAAKQTKPIVDILSSRFPTKWRLKGNIVDPHHTANRMCFWMATGSGKTLVMVKLIAHLEHLKSLGEIPKNDILILAPSDHLIGQIRRTIDEFNAVGNLHLDLRHLREFGRDDALKYKNTARVFYCRADHIFSEQKENLVDWKNYDNDGKWFVFLDEAHKGVAGEAKRKAYYSLLARDGFLFNFSATFVDDDDIMTTVAKYNLSDFIKNGHGKHICVSEDNFLPFHRQAGETGRDKIVLKSLLTLAVVRLVRADLPTGNFYHAPMMLTLVNSVNTAENDLLAFFRVLQNIASGKADKGLLKTATAELQQEWAALKRQFEKCDAELDYAAKVLGEITAAKLRAAVFCAARPGALEYIRGVDNKEIAFKLKTGDEPFALIKIGEIGKWTNDFLAGMTENNTLREKTFFAELENSPNMTILMGSRAFFESWDSTRPNVINFINIGGRDAKKFVVQSVGRGVRIEPIPDQRKRLARLFSKPAALAGKDIPQKIAPLETLFLYAANQGALESVLSGLQAEQEADGGNFVELKGFVKNPPPKINGGAMPFLVPEYKEDAKKAALLKRQFGASKESVRRFKSYLSVVSDSALVVRDGLTPENIGDLRDFVGGDKIENDEDKEYKNLGIMQTRIFASPQKFERTDGVREVIGGETGDIVHFCRMAAHSGHVDALNEIIARVVKGSLSDEKEQTLQARMERGEISQEEFEIIKRHGRDVETYFSDGVTLTFNRCKQHYYSPLIRADQKAAFIRHIVDVGGEARFLQSLERWLEQNNGKTGWDFWGFCKLVEHTDAVYIPYLNRHNDCAAFLPDFVFWMCDKNRYRIFFVDPKSTVYADAYKKIDGYKKLFEENGMCRRFRYNKKWNNVEVKTVFFNEDASHVADGYRRYWTSNPGDIFAD